MPFPDSSGLAILKCLISGDGVHPLVDGTFKSNKEVTGDLITRHWVMSQLDLRVGVSRRSIGGLEDDGLRGISLFRRVGNTAPRAGAVVRCVGEP